MFAQGRIAHFNVARLKHAPGDPRVAEFVDNTFAVNAVAERSPGYVWRLADESALVALDGYQGTGGDPKIAYSLSVWETLRDFQSFVYKTVHGSYFRRREEWFEPWPGPNYVIWDFDGTPPVLVEEGWRRLQHLADHGASDFAYDFKFAVPKVAR
jgi:Domain of unknown function (DUF3291)